MGRSRHETNEEWGRWEKGNQYSQASILSPTSIWSLGGSSMLPARRTLMFVTVHGAWVRAALVCWIEFGSFKNGDEI